MERVKKLRQRAKIVIAFGTCACYGGVSGLIDHSQQGRDPERRVYRESPGSTTKTIPKDDIPELLYRGYAVGDIIKVDYYITGCPPKEAFLRQILLPLIEGQRAGAAEKIGLLRVRP